MTLDAQETAVLAAQWFASANGDARLTERLGSADTSLHIHLSDSSGLTVRLDPGSISAEPRIAGDAEIELWTSPELMLTMVRGEAHLAMLIGNGDVAYRGPVRKFLRVVPVLRSLDFGMWRDAGRSGSAA